MRLLYVCSDFGVPPSGTKGASIHLRSITRALARRGNEVRLLSPKDGPGPEHPAKRLLPAGCPPADRTARHLKDWLKGHGFDDAVARELRPLIFNAWVGDQVRDPLAGNPPEAIIERLSLFGHVGVDIADRLDVPLIVEVNAPLAEEAATFRSLSLQSLAMEMEQRVLRRADAVIAVSAALADHLAARGIDRGKIHVIPNGVDDREFDRLPTRRQCREELGLKDEFVVGFAGSLKPWHGVGLLITAFAEVARRDPSARLLIVGSGPTKMELYEQVRHLGLERSVIFFSAVAHEAVPRLLRTMDVAVAPFRPVANFYFSPIKLFEYMAAGACVVASELGQIAEVIHHQTSGLLCRPDDVAHLASLIEQARQSPKLRARLGTEAQATVRKSYTWAHAAERTEAVVRAALRKRFERGLEQTTAPSSRVKAMVST